VCGGGGEIMESKQVCVDLANSREEINVNMMRVLPTHYTLGFFFHVFVHVFQLVFFFIIIIIISYFKCFLPFKFKLKKLHFVGVF
jgi:hypothetical protein